VKNILEFVPRPSLIFRQAIIFGVLFSLFTFLGGFAIRQAIVLASASHIGVLIIDRIYGSQADFCPMGILVTPNWNSLRAKFDLLKDEKEWGKIQAGLEVLPIHEYNILRNGVCFYSLTPKLIYRSPLNDFVSRHQFVSITEIPEMHSSITVRIDGPVFRVEIVTPESLRRQEGGISDTLGIFWIEPARKDDLIRFCSTDRLAGC
jgi:hypothetical protein